VPLLFSFLLNLCFVGLAGGVWPENIDSRDFAWKLSVIRYLQRIERCLVYAISFPASSSQFSSLKSERLRDAQPRWFNSLFLL
jgi:hypothetical protein